MFFQHAGSRVKRLLFLCLKEGIHTLTVQQRTENEQAKYDKFSENLNSTIHCADIGLITAIDSSSNLLTVKPIIKERIVGNDGKVTWVDFPEIPDTPYIAASGMAPAIGQSVLIIYCDHDISGWIAQGGMNASGTPTSQSQQIMQSHSLSSAVAIVGFGASSTVTPSVSYGQISSSTTPTDIGVSQALVDMIKNWEGWVPTPYQDTGGVWTIGYGHTFTPPWTGSNPLSKEEGDTLLKSDISPRVTSVRNKFPGMSFSQNQLDALVSFVYNAGIGNLDNSGLTKDIKAGASSDVLKRDFESICHDHKGNLLSALVHRRDAEWAMYCNGTYLNNGK